MGTSGSQKWKHFAGGGGLSIQWPIHPPPLNGPDHAAQCNSSNMILVYFETKENTSISVRLTCSRNVITKYKQDFFFCHVKNPSWQTFIIWFCGTLVRKPDHQFLFSLYFYGFPSKLILCGIKCRGLPKVQSPKMSHFNLSYHSTITIGEPY